jgi:hypothetical protein
MRRLHFWAAVTALVVTACATTADEDAPEDLTEPTVNGISATASVNEIVTYSVPATTYPKIQFSVKVTLANTTGTTATVSYRTACSVRIQLRRADDSKVYDETTRACEPGVASLTIPAQSQQTLFSGIRFPATVLGDSLAPGRYRVVAVLQKDDAALLIDAGTYNIPNCDDVSGCRAGAAARGAGK